MTVYVITECRMDASGQLSVVPYVRMASRDREKALGWFQATRESHAFSGNLLDEGNGYGNSVDGEWFSFKSNYGGVYEETVVSFNIEETR